MGRQFSIYHSQCQPRGITPAGQEGDQTSFLTLVCPPGDPAGGTAGQARTHQFSRLCAIVRHVDIGHRLSNVRLCDALVPEFTLQGTPRAAPTSATASYPFRGEVRIVDQAPHSESVHGLVYRRRRMLLLHQSLPQLVLAAGPVSE